MYLTADAKAYDAVCRRFARKVSAVVISVNYRLAPEHRCPAQYDDGFDVLKFLDERKSGVLPENADLSCCFLAGDSAGANLAHNVAKRASESTFTQLKARKIHLWLVLFFSFYQLVLKYSKKRMEYRLFCFCFCFFNNAGCLGLACAHLRLIPTL